MRLIFVVFVVWVLGVLGGCGGSTIPMAPEKSPHFDAVTGRLQLGGTVYTFVDIDGDAERAADFFVSLLRDLPRLPTTDASRPLSATSLVRILGLDDAHAIGLSSYRKGRLYHNRSFVYHTGPREGLMKIFGGEPSDLDLETIAPGSSDLVWEQRFNMKAIVDVVRALGEHGVGSSPARIDAMLAQSAFGLDMSVGEIVDRLDTTAGLIVQVDEARVLRIPGGSFWFPYTDFLFRIDGLGDLVETIARRAAFDPLIRADRTDTTLTIRLGFRLPPPWNAYDPSLTTDLATRRVYLVSNPEYLAMCFSKKGGVASTADFLEAFDGLPPLRNGMLFMSPQLTREMHAILDRMINDSGSSILKTIVRVLLPDAGLPIGWVAANRKDGLLFTSNSSSSHKSTLITLGLAAMLPAIGAAGASKVEAKTDTPVLPFR